MIRPLLVVFAFAALLLATSGAGPIPAGPGKVTVDVGVPLDVFTYKPAGYTDGPLILVFHGVNRNAEDYRDFAISLGDRFNAIVAAPHFDAQRFPSAAYQRGGVMCNGKAQPREKWTYAAVPKIVAGLRRAEGRELPFYIIGHSAGGQFVARMTALAGTQGAERVVAANPGSHLFPTRELAFGYGFGGLPEELSNDDALRRYLAAPLTLYVGTGDNDPNHSSLDRSAPASRQGAHRYARGVNCYASARKLAEARGWEFNWRKVETPGIAHDAAKMFAAAEAQEALFGPAQE